MRKPQASIVARHFSECNCAMIFRFDERRQSERPR